MAGIIILYVGFILYYICYYRCGFGACIISSSSSYLLVPLVVVHIVVVVVVVDW